tara:strand:- start:3643 stop:3981 length:339 start_codon:yes stop_codon:yes gene_type:complete
MNKCIRCGASTNINLYEDRKNIYYGEYLCWDCESMIAVEWGLDKKDQEYMIEKVKEEDISLIEFVATMIKNRFDRINKMANIVGNKEEAWALLDAELRAIKSLMKKIGDEEE